MFAFSTKAHYQFIVKGDDEFELTARIDNIISRHPEYSQEYIVPGVFIIKENSLKDAKLKLIAGELPNGKNQYKPVHPDLPLCRAAVSH